MPRHSLQTSSRPRRYCHSFHGGPLGHLDRIRLRASSGSTVVSTTGRNIDCDVDRLHGAREHCRRGRAATVGHHLHLRTGARVRILVRVAGNAAVRGDPPADLPPGVQRRRGTGTTARAAAALGLNVLLCESFAKNNKSDQGLERISFETFLAESDIISLHCPLTDNTEGLFDETAFEQMKSSAILINTARGGLINDHALIKAIEDKAIAGAAIDVLDQEPPDSDHPLMQKQYSNLIITPHIAWAAREARQRALDRIAENIDAFLKDKPINVVNA